MRCGRIQSLPQEKLTAQDEKMMSERQSYTLFGKNWEGIQFLFRSVQLPYLCKALPRLNGVHKKKLWHYKLLFPSRTRR